MNSTDRTEAELILASSSPFRRELLQRLGVRFRWEAPEVDESLRPGESITQATLRLARAKAEAVAARHPAACVLASDQLCALNEQILGKPGSPERAIDQLGDLSGRAAQFHTAVCLVHGEDYRQELDCTEVHFRRLDAASIERYLAREDVLGCAGSFKSEGLGISLCEAINSNDPTALIGLPLIATARLLREAGFDVP